MLKQYLQLICVLSLLLWAVFQKSAKGITSVGIEPIIGYERSQLLVPTAHTQDRLVYGARATYGFSFFSAEGEYLRVYSSESFVPQNLITKDTADKLKVGIRSGFNILGILNPYFRAGCQATRNRHEESNSGVDTLINEPVKYHPYGGVGLRLGLGGHLKLTGDLNTVFHSFPDMNQNEYQATVGFVVQFP